MLADAKSLAAFWDTLPIQSVVWDEMEQEVRSQLGAGGHLRYDMGGTLWRATVTLDRLEWATSKALRARLRAMKKVNGYFLATDPLSAAPAADPTGAILGVSAVTVHSVDGVTGELRLTGLPNGYVVDQGHMVSIDFGTPAARALLSLDTAATSVGGTTGAFATTPVPWAGIEAGDPVTILRPTAVFAMVAGGMRSGAIRKGLVDGNVFEMVQVLDA
jgi:hypothetical protein